MHLSRRRWVGGCVRCRRQQDFTADSDRIAVDEKQIQLAEEEKVWLYAAIDADSKVVLLVVRISFAGSRGPYLAKRFV